MTRQARLTRRSWLRKKARIRRSGVVERFGLHSLALSMYTDRGSHYFHTAEAGSRVDRGQPTQVGRVLAHLDVLHIAAYSSQARGRAERLFQTLQDRVPKEPALVGITTM